MSLAKKMGDAHEAHLAEVYGGKRTAGSGNQWRAQTDGRHDRRERSVSFAWDGKSTRAASITIKRDDLDKVTEQAFGDRPLLPLRFYGDDRLRIFEDWAVIREGELVELMEVSTTLDRVTRLVTLANEGAYGYERGDLIESDFFSALRQVLYGSEVEVVKAAGIIETI